MKLTSFQNADGQTILINPAFVRAVVSSGNGETCGLEFSDGSWAWVRGQIGDVALELLEAANG